MNSIIMNWNWILYSIKAYLRQEWSNGLAFLWPKFCQNHIRHIRGIKRVNYQYNFFLSILLYHWGQIQSFEFALVTKKLVRLLDIFLNKLCSKQIFSLGIDSCHFLAVPFNFGLGKQPPSLIGWMYPENSMLQPLFDDYIFRILESGIFDRINMEFKVHIP